MNLNILISKCIQHAYLIFTKYLYYNIINIIMYLKRTITYNKAKYVDAATVATSGQLVSPFRFNKYIVLIYIIIISSIYSCIIL